MEIQSCCHEQRDFFFRQTESMTSLHRLTVRVIGSASILPDHGGYSFQASSYFKKIREYLISMNLRVVAIIP